MHEWALAESIVSTVIEVAREKMLKRVTEIKVKLGELQQVDSDVVQSALREISSKHEILLKNAEVKIESEEAILECKVCGRQWPFKKSMGALSEIESESIHFIPETAHAYIKCPACGSPDFKVIKGRGVWVDYIEGQ